jgi:pimeloyl-ACP methyl ester carboxylesterase
MNQDPNGYISLCRVVSAAHAPDYHAVTAPYLLIASDEDKSAALDGCRHIYGKIGSQNKTLEILSGVGHWHCIEAPDEVGRLIDNFSRTIVAT